MDCRAPAGLAVSDLFGVGIIIEIARSGSDAAIQVSLPHSPTQTVRTQSADAANGLLRSARSCDFVRFISPKRNREVGASGSDDAAVARFVTAENQQDQIVNDAEA